MENKCSTVQRFGRSRKSKQVHDNDDDDRHKVIARVTFTIKLSANKIVNKALITSLIKLLLTRVYNISQKYLKSVKIFDHFS